MRDIGIIGLILIVANIAFSYKGLVNNLFFDGYKFDVDRILINKDYKRLITSGFLHVSWSHLIFNMISLYAFSGLLELHLGHFFFLLIYIISLIGGNLLALFIHRHHGDYSAAGASGAICGIIFASIALFPGLGIGFLGLPFFIPSWIYGILYIGFTIYGIQSNKDNVGHEAHLGGALIGMLVAILIQPSTLMVNYLVILLILIPTITFLYICVTKPHLLIINNHFTKSSNPYYDIDHQYNEQKVNKQMEIDKILDKINKKGLKSLSKKELQKLNDYSNN